MEAEARLKELEDEVENSFLQTIQQTPVFYPSSSDEDDG
jgi:hypothetical protein